MNKYNYGYQLTPGTTSEWAFNKIRDNSEVLELGPAIGNLAKHLKEEKGCSVDIIEIDEDAGKMAKRFARNSLIGPEQGNLEANYWYEILENQRYDYIVILDVLEHLFDAESLLKKITKLLKESGELIISLPNIAHNSVILNLLKNQFVYTKDGLLDDTHVKFYTYYSFCEMLERCGLKAVRKEAIQLAVGMNEIETLYDAVPKNVEIFLRTRPLADVYQFLFTAQKNQAQLKEASLEISLLDTTKYKFQVYIEGKMNPIVEEFLDPQYIDYTIKLTEKTRLLRVDPVEYKCVVKVVLIEGKVKGEKIPLSVKYTNGSELGKNVYSFFLDDPNIYIELPENIDEIHFICECREVNSDDLSCYQLISVAKRGLEENKYELEEQKNVLEGQIRGVENQKNELENQKIILEERITILENSELALQSEKCDLENELAYFKGLWFNRFFIYIRSLLIKMRDMIKR